MRLYLSHVAKDLKFASALRAELVKRGFEVWNPEHDLAPGSNWLKEAGRALERADGIVFLLSDRALDSLFIQKEIDYALTTRRFANRIYPVTIGKGAAQIPWILKELGVVRGAMSSPRETAARIAAAAIDSKPKRRPKAQSSMKAERPSGRQ
jgi:hypothetical protein